MERGLAFAGIILWGAGVPLALIPPTDWFLGAISLFLLVLSIREYRRWVAGGPPLSSRSKDRHAYPRTAWFAIGAIPAAIILEIGRAATSTSTSQTRSFDIVAIVVWIAAGEITQRLLVRNAKRNEERAQTAAPPMPTPMPMPPPPAAIAAPASGSAEEVIAPSPMADAGPTPLVSCAACGASNGPTQPVCHRCGGPMRASTLRSAPGSRP